MQFRTLLFGNQNGVRSRICRKRCGNEPVFLRLDNDGNTRCRIVYLIGGKKKTVRAASSKVEKYSRHCRCRNKSCSGQHMLHICFADRSRTHSSNSAFPVHLDGYCNRSHLHKKASKDFNPDITCDSNGWNIARGRSWSRSGKLRHNRNSSWTWVCILLCDIHFPPWKGGSKRSSNHKKLCDSLIRTGVPALCVLSGILCLRSS